MYLTLSTVLNVFIFSCVSILLIYAISANIELLLNVGLKTIVFFIILLLIRLLFPFELPFQYSINVTNIWPDIYMLFHGNLLINTGVEFSLLSLLIIMSLIGSVILFIKILISYILTKFTIMKSYKLIDNSQLNDIIVNINKNWSKNNNFYIFFSNKIEAPFIFGLFKTYIVLPDISYSKNDCYYILKHEIAHYYFKDLWIRYLCEIIIIFYWWNPFIYLLRNIIMEIQELKVDEYVVKDLTEMQQINYIELLIKFTKYQCSKKKEKLSISIISSNKDYILKRIDKILYNKKSCKSNKLKKISLSFILTVFIVIIPYFFIIEPSAIPEEDSLGTFEIHTKDAYYKCREDGDYDFYMNDKYVGTVSEIFDDTIRIE